MPAAFMARSSSFSPKFPKVINAASNIASGSACDTRVMEPNIKNCARTEKSRPLPTKSSIHRHNSWSMKMKRQIKKVPIRFVAKVFMIKRSNFFIILNLGSFIVEVCLAASILYLVCFKKIYRNTAV